MKMDNVWLNPQFKGTKAPIAIFADRDGTLIKHIDYIGDPAQVELLPGVKEAVHTILEAGIPFYILTNQSGVGRGYFPIEQVYACQKRLFAQMAIDPKQLAGWCISPEAPDVKGGYRKPSPRFIEEACRHVDTEVQNCHIIGDTLVDLETAWNSGSQAWAVACGKPELPKEIRQGSINGSYSFRESFDECVQSIMKGDY